MNGRRMRSFWIILTGLALALVTSPATAHTFGGPDFRTLEGLYGPPLMMITDPLGDLFDCQDPNTQVAKSPSDITRVEVYNAPPDTPFLSGYVVAIHTQTPFRQLLDSSHAVWAAIRALDTGGHTENRIYGMPDGTLRSGAADNSFRLIGGTSHLAELSPDGAAALFNLPYTTTQMFIRTFYTAEAGQATVCDSVSASEGVSITLPISWAADARFDMALATATDANNDTVICGAGTSASESQVDITALNVSAAPASAPFPDGYVVSIETAQPPDSAMSSAYYYTVYLNVLRGSGQEQNWLLSYQNGQLFNRVLDADNTPVAQSNRWGDYTSSYGGETAAGAKRFLLNIPGDVTEIQARAALTTTQGGQQVCDNAPADRIQLPPSWYRPIADQYLELAMDDPSGDTVNTATGAPANVPQADITGINIYNNDPLARRNWTYSLRGGIQFAEPSGNVLDNSTLTVSFERGSGGGERIVVERTQEQTTTRVLDRDGTQLYAPGRFAFYDAAQDMAWFVIPVGATQVMVEVAATTADGQQVSDSVGPVDLPATQDDPRSRIPSWFKLCPPLDNLAPDDPLWQEIEKVVNHFLEAKQVLPVSRPSTHIRLWYPQAPYDPMKNRVAIDVDCHDPEDTAPQAAPPALEQVYGAPVMTNNDPAGGSVLCQDRATPVSDNPAAITTINTYTVPDNIVSTNGSVVEVITSNNAQQLFDTSYSFAVVVNAVTITGERANRIIEIHDGAQRIGAADDNGQVIAGTIEWVGFGTNGALFNLPEWVTQMTITTFYSPSADQPSICNTSGVINLPLLASEQTLGSLLDALGITLCPPLDSMFDTSAPFDGEIDPALLLALLLHSSASGNLHLEPLNPEFPPNSLFNPLVLKDGCEGEDDGDN